jgi:hypothetical protein
VSNIQAINHIANSYIRRHLKRFFVAPLSRLRGRFDVEGCERRHTRSAGLKGDRLDDAVIDLLPEQSQEVFVVRKDVS